MSESPLMSRAEAAGYLRISRSHFDRHIRPRFRSTAEWWSKEDLDALILLLMEPPRQSSLFSARREPPPPIPWTGLGIARDTLIYSVASPAGAVKFGLTSRSIRDRMADLQTAHPFKLVALGTVKGDRSDERAIHDALAKWRLEGEWFRWNMSTARLAMRFRFHTTARAALRSKWMWPGE